MRIFSSSNSFVTFFVFLILTTLNFSSTSLALDLQPPVSSSSSSSSCSTTTVTGIPIFYRVFNKSSQFGCTPTPKIGGGIGGIGRNILHDQLDRYGRPQFNDLQRNDNNRHCLPTSGKNFNWFSSNNKPDVQYINITEGQFQSINFYPGHSFDITRGFIYFTAEIHLCFVYKNDGDESLTITSDSDLWLYLNRRLLVDLGGIHSTTSITTTLDGLGLTVGKIYRLDIFFAQRYHLGTNVSFRFNLCTGCCCGGGRKQGHDGTPNLTGPFNVAHVDDDDDNDDEETNQITSECGSINKTYSPTKSPTTQSPSSPTKKPNPSPPKSPTLSPTKEPTTPTKQPTSSSSPPSSPPTPPTSSPTKQPTSLPTKQPTLLVSPTSSPTKQPTASPTLSPTLASPTNQPTNIVSPTNQPPTLIPTMWSTNQPTISPTILTTQPTSYPTSVPTNQPTVTLPPPPPPTPTTTTNQPTFTPTTNPTGTNQPTLSPTIITMNPTNKPTPSPTPTNQPPPSPIPPLLPTNQPTLSLTPTLLPTSQPTILPSQPTFSPTSPTKSPTPAPTKAPTNTPTCAPTSTPTVAPSPQACCGNGIVEPGEQCDNGVVANSDIYGNCTHRCRFPVCGDGIIHRCNSSSNCTSCMACDNSEECDDGNNINGDGCDANCRFECNPLMNSVALTTVEYRTTNLINHLPDCPRLNCVTPPKKDLENHMHDMDFTLLYWIKNYCFCSSTSDV